MGAPTHCATILEKACTQMCKHPFKARKGHIRMKVQRASQQIKLLEWSAQIDECMKSGLSVKQWCEINGIPKKTYYYRLKRVREEVLEAMETGSIHKMAGMAGISAVSETTQLGPEQPVFAALPVPQGKSAAVTVWVGGCAVEIHNGADDAVVEQALKVVSRL